RRRHRRRASKPSTSRGSLGGDCRSGAGPRGRRAIRFLRHPGCYGGYSTTEGLQMNECKVAVLVGSLRQDSYNRRLARAVEKLAPKELKFEHVRIDDLPLYTQDFDANYPPNAQRLKRDIESAQALLFVTPE